MHTGINSVCKFTFVVEEMPIADTLLLSVIISEYFHLVITASDHTNWQGHVGT
jgi:hypothetical protein